MRGKGFLILGLIATLGLGFAQLSEAPVYAWSWPWENLDLSLDADDSIYLKNGNVLTDCRIQTVTGVHVMARCGPEESRRVINRIWIEGRNDRVTLRNGEVIDGEIFFANASGFELWTDVGMRRIPRGWIVAIRLGAPLATSQSKIPQVELEPLPPPLLNDDLQQQDFDLELSSEQHAEEAQATTQDMIPLQPAAK